MKQMDYYEILEVSKGASAEEIKQAYRRLARRYHPDVSDDHEAEERFKEVSEAYEVLGDPHRRAAYDLEGACGWIFRSPPRWGRRFPETGPDCEEGMGPGDPSGLDSGMQGRKQAGDAGGLDAGGPSWSQGVARDLEASLVVTVEEAYHGTQRTLSLAGAGEVTVSVPAGVRDGQCLRIPGKGLRGAGGQAGDLCLHVSIIAHDLYRIKGKTILLDVPIAPWEAALGATLRIPTPSGWVRVRVSPGAWSGQKLRLAGRGMPAPDGPGDFYARLQIVMPTELSEEEKALYRRLAELSGFDPRAHFPPRAEGG